MPHPTRSAGLLLGGLALQAILAVRASAQTGDALASWDWHPASAVTLSASDTRVPGEVLVGLRDADVHEAFVDEAARRGHVLVGEIPRLKILKVSCVPGREDEAARDLLNVHGVVYAETNRLGSAAGIDDLDDPCVVDQWHLKNDGSNGGVPGADLDIESAWQVSRGSPTITVAVLDSGIEFDHPEFVGRLLPGYDFYFDDSDPTSHFFHGIMMTGLIGANADNGYGGAGLDHACRLLPVKVLNDGGFGDVFDLCQGLDYVASLGVNVVNMSLEHYPNDMSLEVALHGARGAGCILVACAGNAGKNDADKSWPGASPDAMSIGCTDNADTKVPFSGTGQELDFVAPGKALSSADSDLTGPQCILLSGTSDACALTSGIAALLLSVRPDLSQDDIYALLAAGAKDQVGPPSDDTPGWDNKYGYGRLSAGASLHSLERLLATFGSQGVPTHVSSAKGGYQLIITRVDPKLRGSPWITLGSLTGSVPGTLLFHLRLPLNADHYFLETLAGSGGLLNPPFGIVPDDGVILQSVDVPANWQPSLDVMHLTHAVMVVHDPPVVSNAVPLAIDP